MYDASVRAVSYGSDSEVVVFLSSCWFNSSFGFRSFGSDLPSTLLESKEGRGRTGGKEGTVRQIAYWK